MISRSARGGKPFPKITPLIPKGLPRVINSAWHSLNDICKAWNIPDKTRAKTQSLMIERGRGFEFGGDYFAIGESIMRAFWDAKKAEDASSQNDGSAVPE